MITTIIFDVWNVLLWPKFNLTRSSSFFDKYSLNGELVNYIDNKLQKYHCGVFTSIDLTQIPELKQYLSTHFKILHSTKDIGLSKDDPNCFTLLAKKLNTEVTSILFIDDTEENVIAARAAGLHGLHFTSNKQLVTALEKKLN